MKTYHKVAFAIASLLPVIPAAAATNLLSNGSFENNLTGWNAVSSGTTTSDAQVISFNSNSAYPNGAYGESVPTDNRGGADPDSAGSKFLYFSTDTGTQTISQAVQLLAGHTYTFGYDYYLPANGYFQPR